MIDKSLFPLPGAKKALLLLAALAIGQALCTIGQAWSLSGALTNIWYAAPIADQTTHIAVFLACFIARQALVYLQDLFLDSYAYRQSNSLRQRLMEKVFATQAQVVRDNGTAATVAAVLEGNDQVENYLRVIIPKTIGLMVIPLTVVIGVFTLDWVSGIILLVLFPTIIAFMIMLGRVAKDRARSQYAVYNVMSNHFVDTLRGIETLKVFGSSRGYAQNVFDVSERFRRATIDTLKVATLSGAVLDMIATLGVAAVSVMLAFRLIGGSLELFAALAVLIMSPEYFKPIRNFASDFHASLDGKNALSAIESIIDAEDDDLGSAQTIAAWNEGSEMKLEHVSFAYGRNVHDVPANPFSDSKVDFGKEDEQDSANLHDASQAEAPTHGDQRDTAQKPALADITFAARGATKIGIVGASGSGKSTLARLLGGFSAPSEGDIVVDGASIKTLQQPDWHTQVLYIPQDPYLFHMSLRDNITFYSPHATDDAVFEAVRVLGLDKLVDSLPQGIDTIIGEGARGLSGGQAQRIALARALLDDNRKVLIFDEPTAHLDIETELELKQRMLPIMEGKLVFFATHRLHWLENMDYVIVLEDGRIAQAGTPKELYSTQGALRRLAAQARQGEAS